MWFYKYKITMEAKEINHIDQLELRAWCEEHKCFWQSWGEVFSRKYIYRFNFEDAETMLLFKLRWL